MHFFSLELFYSSRDVSLCAAYMRGPPRPLSNMIENAPILFFLPFGGENRQFSVNTINRISLDVYVIYNAYSIRALTSRSGGISDVSILLMGSRTRAREWGCRPRSATTSASYLFL